MKVLYLVERKGKSFELKGRARFFRKNCLFRYCYFIDFSFIFKFFKIVKLVWVKLIENIN